jgi:hypothetical protein
MDMDLFVDVDLGSSSDILILVPMREQIPGLIPASITCRLRSAVFSNPQPM